MHKCGGIRSAIIGRMFCFFGDVNSPVRGVGLDMRGAELTDGVIVIVIVTGTVIPRILLFKQSSNAPANSRQTRHHEELWNQHTRTPAQASGLGFCLDRDHYL